MPRPVRKNETPQPLGNATVKHTNGTDVLTEYADKAIWNETQSKFEKPEDVIVKR